MAMREPPSSGFAWQLLGQYADIPERGRSLFQGTRAQQESVWREFRNYVRQAKAYFDGAQHVSGSSSALLYYYSFLNLAKAELLRTVPQQIVNRDIKHGITHRPNEARTIRRDHVTVRPGGVFPLLYRARTGLTPPAGAVISIPRILGSIPGIGWELHESGIGVTRCSRILCVTAIAATEIWSVIALDESLPNPAIRRVLSAHYELTHQPPGELMMLGNYLRTVPLSFWQSKWTLPRTDHLKFDLADCFMVAKRAWTYLKPYIDPSPDPGIDGILNPSVGGRVNFPMPSSLASYVGVFYLSSLVRYKPQQLDPQNFPTQAWLMDSLARETCLPLLLRAVSGITGKTLTFAPTVGAIRH
jgi:hypothetical protein